MSSSSIVPENFQQPDEFYKGLTYRAQNGGGLPEEFYDSRSHLDIRRKNYPHELCVNCGWTSGNQIGSTYGSRVRIIKTYANRGLWALGSQLLLKDIPNDGSFPGNENITYRWLRSQPSLTIPLLDRMELLSKPTDKTYLLLMSRAEGEPLDKSWFTLPPEQQENLIDQLYLILKQLRQFTASGAQNVEGGELNDIIIGRCNGHPKCKKIGFSTDKWLENLKPELQVGLAKEHKTKDMAIIETEFQKLKDNFPNSEPYVFTHGDLDLSNIMVKDNLITAIIDWEYAGFYPWWAEHYVCGALNSGAQQGLLYPALYRLDPGMEDRMEGVTGVYNQVAIVKSLWNNCKVKHPGFHDTWYRPPFSACEPYAGFFKRGLLGGSREREHKVEDLNLLEFKNSA